MFKLKDIIFLYQKLPEKYFAPTKRLKNMAKNKYQKAPFGAFKILN